MPAKIETMGKFTAIGMRTTIDDAGSLIINTCSDNDTDFRGRFFSWSWANPTNRRWPASFHPVSGAEVLAVSVECLWHGTKIFADGGEPNKDVLLGNWRGGKAKRPIGAWNGLGNALITNTGDARRAIYLPAFAEQIVRWIENDPAVRQWVQQAREHDGPVYLRDFDTGRGVNRKGPMSHAWVLAHYLNTGEWPKE